MQKLKDWFNALNARERAIVIAGALVVLVAVLYVAALAPFYAVVNGRANRVAKKQADLAWMQSVAGEVREGSLNGPNGGPEGEAFVVLVDRVSRECGIGGAVTGQVPNGDNGVRVQLESAEFDKLVACLGNLQQVYAVSIEQASIDRAAKPGFVNASIVLNRAGG